MPWIKSKFLLGGQSEKIIKNRIKVGGNFLFFSSSYLYVYRKEKGQSFGGDVIKERRRRTGRS
jgi:hypothetical protein